MSSELHTIFPPRQMAGPSRSHGGQRSNVSLLTEGAGYIKRAKKGKQDEVEKIVFDDDKRKEFLTGFRKRKQAKIEERRQRAKKRDHDEHLAERNEARRDLKRRAEENVRQVRMAMGLPADPEGDGDDGTVYKGSSGRSGRGNKAGGEDDEEMNDDSGDDDDDDEDSEEEDAEEYEGDDQMAVVTIQDDFEDELMGLKKKKKASETAPEPIPFLPPSSRKQTKKRLAQSKLPQAKKLISTLAPPEEKTNIKQISSDYRSFETKAERRKMREIGRAHV